MYQEQNAGVGAYSVVCCHFGVEGVTLWCFCPHSLLLPESGSGEELKMFCEGVEESLSSIYGGSMLSPGVEHLAIVLIILLLLLSRQEALSFTVPEKER
ncbi:hypothetical protein TNCV_311041 [Trichonephila clavipes]|nr:hypothetical protein TNCV_311041 [Trichonephila clavipes]